MDARTDGRRLDNCTISSLCEPGSGELISAVSKTSVVCIGKLLTLYSVDVGSMKCHYSLPHIFLHALSPCDLTSEKDVNDWHSFIMQLF